MKALVVLVLVIVAAASLVAYGRADVAAGMAAVVHTSHADEPIALLLSGSALIGLGGALRRFAF